MTPDELEREIAQMNTAIDDYEDIEKDGYKNIIKYFDRIHDKLFSFNNIMIGGYFFLASFENSISFSSIMFPLGNMGILIWIDYRMMVSSRVESKIMNIPQKDHRAYEKSIDRTNLYSLFTIVSTMIVIGGFVWNIYSIPKKSKTIIEKAPQTIILDTLEKITLPPIDSSVLLEKETIIKNDPIENLIKTSSHDSLIRTNNVIDSTSSKK